MAEPKRQVAAPNMPPPDVEWEDGTKGTELPPPDVQWEDGSTGHAAPPAPPTRAMAPDPGIGGSLWHGFQSGFWKQGADEALGLRERMAQTAVPGMHVRMPNGEMRPVSTQEDIYRAARDSERQTQESAQEHHRIASFIGNVAGDVGSDFLLSRLGVPVSNSAYQTASGALSGFLGSDADLTPDKATPGHALEATASTGLGAGMGYFLPKIGAAIAKSGPGQAAIRGVTSRIRQALEGVATSQGNRMLLNGGRALANKMPVSDAAVMQALDDDAIRMFGTTSGAWERLQELAEQRGITYADVLRRLEAEGVKGPEAVPLANAFMEKYKDIYHNSGSDKTIANLFKSEAENIPDILKPGDQHLGLIQADRVKRSLQDKPKWDVIHGDALNTARQDAARMMKEAVEEQVEQAGMSAVPGSELADAAEAFLPIKRSLHLTKQAEEAARLGAARGGNRAAVGLPDYIMAAGQDAGLPEKFTTAWLLSQIRSRGASTASKGAYLGSKAVAELGKPVNAVRGASVLSGVLGRQATSSDLLHSLVAQNPEALGEYGPVLSSAAQRGPAALAAQDYVLTQSDPTYREKKAAAQKELERQQ